MICDYILEGVICDYILEGVLCDHILEEVSDLCIDGCFHSEQTSREQ